MFHKMIEKARNNWYASSSCTINPLVDYIVNSGHMRDAQIEAIKTYLYLKIGCENKPLSYLFANGYFNTMDLDAIEISNTTREYFEEHAEAAALYEYATQTNDNGETVSLKLAKQIKQEPTSIDYKKFFYDAFYEVDYTDYLFSLPMGAGKTYLMAAFIYLDLYFATNEPQNLAFAHNFIIFAPSGLKSSVVPSLKTIQNFNPAWIIPEPAATEIKRKMIFEVLDQNKTASKSNKVKNPNVQKIANHQPFSDLFGLVAVTNAEKVIYDRIEKEDLQLSLFSEDEQAKIRQSKELREIIGKLPNLAVYIDEVHHASAGGDSKLRKVVNRWSENNSVNSVIGFSGTPYLEKTEKISATEKLAVATQEITNVVYYYPLIKGVGNFLKKPIVKISDVSEREVIIENGVRDFLNTYKDTVYEGGLTAKLGIYCGTSIEKCEEVVYPIVKKIVAEYGMPTDCILRFHRGNKQYPQPVDSQLEFDTLDTEISKIRIVLLVQIGKEGWDCRSLTGIILSQEGDCPKNMVLQTSCRCLREVTKDNLETALIYLNQDNAEKLNSQLMQQQHISLKEFSSAENDKKTIYRFDRTKYLKLPKIAFCQLRINYNTLITEEATDENICKKINAATYQQKKENTVKTSDFSTKILETEFLNDEKGTTPASLTRWLYKISKDSLGFISIEKLEEKISLLSKIFDEITYEKDGVRYFSSQYNKSVIEANIRKAFYDEQYFETVEELMPIEASLLKIENLKEEISADDVDKFYPDSETVKKILLEDKGKLKMDAKTTQMLKLAEETGQEAFAESIRKQFTSHINKDRSFHYLPYKTDSDLEIEFLKKILTYKDITDLDLEVYYNGERAMTEFKIKCYKKTSNQWKYIGMYTPDFLIIKRKDKKIDKAIIVETKGGAYAESFKDRRDFMSSEFIKQNNQYYGYKRFDFLYLEDTLSDDARAIKTHNKILEFFKA